MSDLLERLRTAVSERYRVEREIGAGGMAMVYLAEDIKHHRQVAIKVLRAELDMSQVDFDTPDHTWEFVRRLKDTTNMKVLVKGIVRGDDARRCIASGADGIIVSNHGGRATASGRATITALPEVLGAVGGRMPVLIDSGFRRGTDILKALALGATAVCIGRPYLWGLAAFGQEGVERVLDILRTELRIAMQLSGVPSARNIDPTIVIRT